MPNETIPQPALHPAPKTPGAVNDGLGNDDIHHLPDDGKDCDQHAGMDDESNQRKDKDNPTRKEGCPHHNGSEHVPSKKAKETVSTMP